MSDFSIVPPAACAVVANNNSRRGRRELATQQHRKVDSNVVRRLRRFRCFDKSAPTLILQSRKQLYQSAQSTNHWSGFKMKHDNSLASWQKLVVAAGLGTLGSVLVITTSFAQSSVNCRAYAEDYSLRHSAPRTLHARSMAVRDLLFLSSRLL